MSQTIDRLVYMANQIATAFKHQEPDKAIEAVYDHIWHFWDPRMRQLIIDYHRQGGEGLSHIARGAIERLHRDGGQPVPVTRATEFSHLGEGEDVSDAG